MSRRKSGNIPVEVVEVKAGSDTKTQLEVHIKNKVAGTVAQKTDNKVVVTFHSGRQQNVSSIDEGIEAILMDYNLHNL